jgi:hypothetical protein
MTLGATESCEGSLRAARASLAAFISGPHIRWFNEGGRHGAQGLGSAGPNGEDRSPAAAGRPG